MGRGCRWCSGTTPLRISKLLCQKVRQLRVKHGVMFKHGINPERRASAVCRKAQLTLGQSVTAPMSNMTRWYPHAIYSPVCGKATYGTRAFKRREDT